MRRSAAPSMTSNKALPVAKRGKFSTPFKSPEVRKLPICLEVVAQEDGNSSQGAREESPEKENVPNSEAFHEKGHVETDKEPLIAVKEIGETFDKKPVPECRTKPQFQCNRTGPIQQVKVQEKSCTETQAGKSKYYNVVWCKASKKKHKTWDGDGILIVAGKNAVLKDSEGKDIGRTSSYKATELSTLTDGATLFVGGKELEVLDEIAKDLYHSGKCFIQSSSAASSGNVSASAFARKPKQSIIKPLSAPTSSSFTSSSYSQKFEKSVVTVAPRHSPDAEGAIVMSRPSASHQWLHNKQGLPVVDVVIDPYLAAHLRMHQVEGVSFLYNCVTGMGDFDGNGAILADEMGLGKTLQCITLVWTLLKQGPYSGKPVVRRVIIVTPGSLVKLPANVVLKQGPYSGKPVVRRVIIVTPGSLVKNWCAEFKKWLGDERLKTFPVSSEKRIEEFSKSIVYPVMIVSYEMLLRYLPDVKKIKFDLIVCDEAHRLKNFGIKTAAAITGLSISRMVLLTGTPIQNDLKEFYALGQLCNPGIFGTTSSFRQVFENPINKSQQPNCSADENELGCKRAAELKRLANLFVLRRTSEVNKRYLPAKVELAVFCNISPLQKKVYEQILHSRAVRTCLSSYYNGSQHLVCISTLKKLCNHPLLLYKTVQEFNEARTLDEEEDEDVLYDGLLEAYPNDYLNDFKSSDAGKLQVLAKLVDEFKDVNEKVVIVSNSTKTLDIFENLLAMKKRQFLRLDGKTSTSERQRLVDRFNEFSDIDAFLLSSKAGGTGLNLVGAPRLVLYDIDWNPANDIQAMARIWRDGQKKKVFIYRLLTTVQNTSLMLQFLCLQDQTISEKASTTCHNNFVQGTIEEKIYQRQIAKQGLSGSVVDLKSDKVSFSRKDLKDLFTLRESSTCSTHELLSCNCLMDTEHNITTVGLQDTRPQQLGQYPARSESKPLSMAELMSWTHIQPAETSRLKDKVLRRCLENVSFVFQNESETH